MRAQLLLQVIGRRGVGSSSARICLKNFAAPLHVDQTARLHTTAIAHNADEGLPASEQRVPKLPTSIKSLNKMLATQNLPDLPEHELEEKFVRGISVQLYMQRTADFRLRAWWTMHQ